MSWGWRLETQCTKHNRVTPQVSLLKAHDHSKQLLSAVSNEQTSCNGHALTCKVMALESSGQSFYTGRRSIEACVVTSSRPLPACSQDVCSVCHKVASKRLQLTQEAAHNRAMMTALTVKEVVCKYEPLKTHPSFTPG
jgi:hypothetical protein